MRKVLFVSLLLATITLTGCSSKIFGQKQPPRTPETRTVDIKNSIFMPATLTIKQGDTVVWTNQDTTQHIVIGDKIKSETLNTGGTYQAAFKKKGTYNYSCGLNPTMKGTVVVE